ncbi:TetR/AcrR family transcriptional regulator [Vibrio sonorensis]|uniref:TetR/AcrR family transcriptional regulator n=1 Tax=Vibrio sonorensis TaxID=1004316 RepID=UPI0008D9394E|nr:TetR/AcrR family transcriptional regulator [Vibrio sonorensis]
MKPTINEQVLLDAALIEFTEQTYQTASLNRILQSAKIAKGSFYYRFKSKYELYRYLIQVSVEKKDAFIQGALENKTVTEGDLFDLLLRKAELSYEFAAKHPHYYQLAKRFSAEKSNSVYHKVIRDLSLDGEDKLSSWVGDLYDSGAFSPEFTKEYVQQLIVTIFTRFDQLFFTEDNYDIELAKSYLSQTVTLLRKSLQNA